MAAPVLADARAYLTAVRGVAIIDNPAPREPDCMAFVMAGIRCYEVRATAADASAAHHLRDGEWLALAESGTANAAFASIAAHVGRIGHLPAWHAPGTDAAWAQREAIRWDGGGTD